MMLLELLTLNGSRNYTKESFSSKTKDFGHIRNARFVELSSLLNGTPFLFQSSFILLHFMAQY